ncbi:response regulator receiver protein [Intrasporangium chromatireducens Q5-1]|uniref:Response regulator receiver protein n=1 Tax=Intrasporangium chromatireducens Q5-1 TaxID=584657 RepID=W9GIA6_9MICO|nr:response regulator transcription factor [Intrasporangium chromatireducens]EWT05976.1 response regulator receiver protein [Intrasporangium chromatireducens Q5-1]
MTPDDDRRPRADEHRHADPALREDASGRPPQPVTVVVADDHPMWRDAVARDLTDAGFEVVATAEDGRSAVARTRATRPDVLVLDLELPGLRGPEVCAALTAAEVPTRVLILSASGEHADVLEAVKAGALGYLVKSARREEFLDAVRATSAGEPVFTPGLAGLVLGEFRRVKATSQQEATERPIPELTDRETEILTYVATGMGYKEIAAALFLSHRTVQNHVQNILGKLQMHNRVELVRFALERGIDPATHEPRGAAEPR